MTKIIHTQETNTTPQVILDSEKGLISFKGKIVTVDCDSLFKPIFNWLNNYIISPCSQTQINIQLDYFNTISTKYLIILFRKIETQLLYKNDIKVSWYYDVEDEDMIEIAEDFQSVTKIPFELVQIN